MILVEQHIIKKTNSAYNELDQLCFLSKNLYNSAVYTIRQHYFNTKKYLNKFQLINEFTQNKQQDYIKLPRKVSQRVIYQVDNVFKSFFKLLKKKQNGQYNKPIKLPYYKNKLNGRNYLEFTKQAISYKNLKQGIISFGKNINFTLNTDKTNIHQVRIIPRKNYIIVEVLYEIKDIKLKENNYKYLSIDLGINNLATCIDNKFNGFIINGKPLKSINHYYNKKLSYYKSIQDIKNKSAYKNKIYTLTLKRNNKIKDYLHKVSKYITNHLVSNNINTLIIGYNKEWKQEVNMHKDTNQNFVQIPHKKFIDMLAYKCKLYGINVIIQEESYTSKCSFYDNETIKKHNIYKGKRIKRGLFKTSTGLLINADINGSLNIMKKAVPNVSYEYGIKVCSMPSVISL